MASAAAKQRLSFGASTDVGSGYGNMDVGSWSQDHLAQVGDEPLPGSAGALTPGRLGQARSARPRGSGGQSSRSCHTESQAAAFRDQDAPPPHECLRDPPLIRRVKAAVLTGPRFDAAEADIARELGLSGRTLRRRLRDSGTTYAQTLAEVRFAFAKRCLSDPALTICEVADLAGYSEVSNFRNAFKRWSNCSPRVFREGLGLGSGGQR